MMFYYCLVICLLSLSLYKYLIPICRHGGCMVAAACHAQGASAAAGDKGPCRQAAGLGRQRRILTTKWPPATWELFPSGPRLRKAQLLRPAAFPLALVGGWAPLLPQAGASAAAGFDGGCRMPCTGRLCCRRGQGTLPPGSRPWAAEASSPHKVTSTHLGTVPKCFQARPGSEKPSFCAQRPTPAGTVGVWVGASAAAGDKGASAAAGLVARVLAMAPLLPQALHLTSPHLTSPHLTSPHRACDGASAAAGWRLCCRRLRW